MFLSGRRLWVVVGELKGVASAVGGVQVIETLPIDGVDLLDQVVAALRWRPSDVHVVGLGDAILGKDTGGRLP